ncbi:MAG TPA: efflux RND transporter periplasmic adaptor subunit [Chitinophagaceae bacterium]|nr:efflux RND transporter periplasmic adaptor subunit [Chitinophagaceae bacterium]
MKHSIIRISLLSLACVFFLYSCQMESEDKEKAERAQEEAAKEKAGLKPDEVMLTKKQFDIMKIELGNPVQKNLTNIVKSNGFITSPPQNKANVSPVMGGIVKSVSVIPGSYVKKGQVLAYLEHPDYIQLQEDYLKAKSSLVFLEQEYNRQKNMLSDSATSKKLVQQTQSNYNTISATVLSLKNKLSLLGIPINSIENGRILQAVPLVSPISGYVQKVNVNVGKFADPTQIIFEIYDNSTLFIDLQIYQQDLGKIHIGQKLTFTTPSLSTANTMATIYAIDKAFDSSNKSITVHARVDRNSRADLMPGIYVNAFIETGNESVTALPEEAIFKIGETENIFILSRTHVEKQDTSYIFSVKEVKTGASEAGYTQVSFLENFPPSAKVVTKGTYFLVSEKNKAQGGEQD